MPEDVSIESRNAREQYPRAAETITQPPDPEYPDIPYPIIRPVRGSPYYINPRSGRKACLLPPGTPPLTLEVVRRALEDFP
jgi:hypothetical protein